MVEEVGSDTISNYRGRLTRATSPRRRREPRHAVAVNLATPQQSIAVTIAFVHAPLLSARAPVAPRPRLRRRYVVRRPSPPSPSPAPLPAADAPPPRESVAPPLRAMPPFPCWRPSPSAQRRRTPPVDAAHEVLDGMPTPWPPLPPPMSTPGRAGAGAAGEQVGVDEGYRRGAPDAAPTRGEQGGAGGVLGGEAVDDLAEEGVGEVADAVDAAGGAGGTEAGRGGDWRVREVAVDERREPLSASELQVRVGVGLLVRAGVVPARAHAQPQTRHLFPPQANVVATTMQMGNRVVGQGAGRGMTVAAPTTPVVLNGFGKMEGDDLSSLSPVPYPFDTAMRASFYVTVLAVRQRVADLSSGEDHRRHRAPFQLSKISVNRTLTLHCLWPGGFQN
nr:formin-like protein 3 [Lolium perenne]